MKRLNNNHLKLKAESDYLCLLCHPRKTMVGRTEHLGLVLDEKVLTYLGNSMVRDQVTLPLNEKSEILCVTCHYQHQIGAIMGGHDPAKGHFYRLRTRPEKLCQTCHE